MQSILGTTRKADITFHSGGRINISARVSKCLDLENGDVIDIMVDERKEEYYLYVKHRAPIAGRHEGMVMKSNRHGMHYVASSKKICEYMLALCKCTDDILKLPMGTPTDIPICGTALPIITRLKL